MINVNGAACTLQRHQPNAQGAFNRLRALLWRATLQIAGKGAVDDLQRGDTNAIANNVNLCRLIRHAHRDEPRCGVEIWCAFAAHR